MASKEEISRIRTKLIFTAVLKFYSLESNKFSGEAEENDIKSLLKFDDQTSQAVKNIEFFWFLMTKWVVFVERFPTDPGSCFEALKELNTELTTKSVLKGDGFKPSEADVIVFAAIHSVVIGLSKSDKEKLPHVMRWMDYIQNRVDFGDLFEKISIEKAKFEPQGAKAADQVEVESDAKKPVQSTKAADKPEAELKTKKNDTAVGLIRKAWKHPSADSLLVEEIDVGEAKLRQVVSGLAKYCSPEQLTNRHVVLITNVKPGKLRDVMSEGLVLCASDENHTVVEPLLPPEGAKPGERVSFAGIDGKPEDVLNPKKKQLDKITPQLFTDEKGIATFNGIPFMTSAGPCTSSIPNASIK
ncbi:hypothetical protein TIFTF001_010362 [Ficus carica]|uniref:tRNA-binding domain-containing protein n=1 Tax=Ficus carica TaxID=3494 RepID=A0AA88A8K0_FICCA|nr:hypothetical protein TIFTF001_010362 [Ficus carica]